MVFYTTYINVDLAHHEIYRAKVGKGSINPSALSTYAFHTGMRQSITLILSTNVDQK